MHAFTVDLDLPMEQAIERLKALLATVKMGVVSEVDMQAAMKAKLGHEMPPYKILGICGPGYAKRVLDADADLGAVLPCGCAVFAVDGGKTRIALRNPETVSALSEHTEVKTAMDEARSALEGIARQLGAEA